MTRRIGPFGTGDAAAGSLHGLPGIDELRAVAALAVTIAEEVGGFLVDGRSSPEVAATKSSYRDVVTEMDRGAEQRIVSAIVSGRPGDGIVGEEGAQRASASGFAWHVDPIDGTVNYLYGLPEWAVSLGVTHGDVPVVGVVRIPMQGETFVAVRGGGARVRHDRDPATDRLLAVNDPVELSHALVATGFGYETGRRTRQAEVVGRLVPAVRDLRRGGSCAIDLCSLAAGRVDAYYEVGPHSWDYAAGGLVAAEAGAVVRLVDLVGEDDPLVVATGPHLVDELTAAVRPSAQRTIPHGV